MWHYFHCCHTGKNEVKWTWAWCLMLRRQDVCIRPGIRVQVSCNPTVIVPVHLLFFLSRWYLINFTSCMSIDEGVTLTLFFHLFNNKILKIEYFTEFYQYHGTWQNIVLVFHFFQYIPFYKCLKFPRFIFTEERETLLSNV